MKVSTFGPKDAEGLPDDLKTAFCEWLLSRISLVCGSLRL